MEGIWREEMKCPCGLKPQPSAKGFNKKWLKFGTKVEMEHTTNPKLAQKISIAHLREHPLYYAELQKMEKRLGI